MQRDHSLNKLRKSTQSFLDDLEVRRQSNLTSLDGKDNEKKPKSLMVEKVRTNGAPGRLEQAQAHQNDNSSHYHGEGPPDLQRVTTHQSFKLNQEKYLAPDKSGAFASSSGYFDGRPHLALQSQHMTQQNSLQCHSNNLAANNSSADN